MKSATVDKRGLLAHWFWILAVAGALLGAASGLVLAGTPRLARIELERRVGDLARLSGFEIRVDSVSIDLRGALVLQGVSAVDRRGTGVALEASRLRTRMHVGAFLRGLERQVDLDVDDLVVDVPGRSAGPEVAYGLLRRLGALGRSAPFAGVWRVAVEGGRVRQSGPGDPSWGVASLRLLLGRPSAGQPAAGQLVGTLSGGAEGPVTLTATLALDGREGEQLTAELGAALPVGPIAGLRARGLSVRGDTLQLDGVRADLASGERALHGVARAVVLRTREGRPPVAAEDVAAVAIFGLDADVRLDDAPGLLELVVGDLTLPGRSLERVDVTEGDVRLALGGDARLTLHALTLEATRAAAGDALRGSADAELSGLVVDAGWLAGGAVTVPTMTAAMKLGWPGADGERLLTAADGAMGAARFEAELRRGRAAGWSLAVRAPDQPCVGVAEALPGALLPGLRRTGQPVEGRLRGSVTITGSGPEVLGWELRGRAPCLPGPLGPEREAGLAGIVAQTRHGVDLPDPVRRWAVALLASQGDGASMVRAPGASDLASASSGEASAHGDASPGRPTWGPLERLAAATLPPPDGTLAWRLGLAVASLRLAALLDPDEIAGRLALDLPIGGVRGLPAAGEDLLAKGVDELTALDVAYLVALGVQGGEPPRHGPLDEALRKRVATNMRELMLAGTITAEEFVGAAPYDPLGAARPR